MPNNDTYEYSWGRAAVRPQVTWEIGRKYEGDLERDRHKVCIAREPEQQTQSLCCLDGSTQSLIRYRCWTLRGVLQCWMEVTVVPVWENDRWVVVDCCCATRQTMWPKKYFHHPPHHHQHPALNIQHSIASSLRQIVERLWVLPNRKLDFESVVLFSHTTPLNQTLSRSTSPPYIPRYHYYSPGLSTTVRAIPIISLFTKTHPPFLKQSVSLSISPINTDSHQYPKDCIFAQPSFGSIWVGFLLDQYVLFFPILPFSVLTLPSSEVHD